MHTKNSVRAEPIALSAIHQGAAARDNLIAMSAYSDAPGTQAKRFAAYLDRLGQAAGHADRTTPLKSYCTGLLLSGERKSVEPMAARLYPDKVRQAHQSLHLSFAKNLAVHGMSDLGRSWPLAVS